MMLATAQVQVMFTVAVKQSNIALLEQMLLSVSDPLSSQYGKHLSLDQVNALVHPKASSIQAVLTWMSSYGISAGGS